MRGGNHARLVLVVCAGLTCLLLGYAAKVACEEPVVGDNVGNNDGGVQVLFPTDRSVLLSGELDLICTAEDGALEVDGEPYDWEPFQPPLRVAHLSLYPGRNTLRVGRRQMEIFVARTAQQPGGPEGWPLCRSHPIEGQGPKRCAGCHETKQHSDRISIGELKSHKACFECHESVEFELIHSHPLEPIEPCRMCHAIHGSTRKALLKAPVKKLCDECHES